MVKDSEFIQAIGTVEQGDTYCDSDPQEKALQHSLDTAIAGIFTHNTQLNILDTPGFPDFLGRSISVLPAVETAAVVINAQTGIQPVAQRMMEIARQRKLCRMVIVNKIDCADINLPSLLDDIKEHFGAECLPINLPAENGAQVIDCFFHLGDEATDFSSVAQAHTEIIDQVVEVDEKLMETYLEQGQEMAPEQLHEPFEKALRDNHLIPVCFVSARSGAGIPQLLDILVRLMPNPTEGNPPAFMKGEGSDMAPVQVTPDADRHTLAHVFKIVNDPFKGRLGILRIHQGTITPESQLFIGDARKTFKVSHLLRIKGNAQEEMNIGVPGDICAIPRLEEAYFDAVLHDSHDEDHHHMASIDCPLPLFGLAIKSQKRGDEQKLSDALHKLEAEDPCFKLEHHVSTNETIILGLGELHIRVVLEKLLDRYHVEVETHPPSIAYRETIQVAAEGQHRHKKQTGGAGQFGEVSLRLEPLARGEGFEFQNNVVGGAIPSQFIPAIEKGVRQALSEGAIAGYPIQDVRVVVHDGKHHAVDSKEIAFTTAGRKAFLDAIHKARPVVLEPLVQIEVTAPNAAMGDLSGDLASRRGHVTGTESLTDGRISISGEVPLAELEAYESRLKSLTAGEGSYRIEFSRYEQAPTNVQKALEGQFKNNE